MLPVHLQVCKEAKKIICRNITGIFELLLDMCTNLSDEEVLNEIFPSFMLQEDIKKCKNVIIELLDMCCDQFERHSLKPVYEYALFHSLQWWFSVIDEEEELWVEIPMNYAIGSSGENLYSYLNDKESYFEFMFEDWDFDDVPLLIEIYRKNPQLLQNYLHINLDDYIELMPPDIRKAYLESKGNKIIFEDSDEEYIIKTVYNVLSLESNRPKIYENFSEPDLSDTICNMANLCLATRDIHMDREDRIGFALKAVGETDFYIWKTKDGIYKKIAIGENKKWGKYESSLKQLIGYMDNDVEFGFTIIFNQNTDLNTVLTKRLEILESFHIDQNFKVLGQPEQLKDMPNVLRTKHEHPEHKGTYFYIYHFIFNIHKPLRKNAALKART